MVSVSLTESLRSTEDSVMIPDLGILTDNRTNRAEFIINQVRLSVRYPLWSER
jgi:hypothetical protein